MRKGKSSKANNIKSVFKLLGIRKSDYPPYNNPEEFAGNFKKCSLLKPHETRQSNSTFLDLKKEESNA